MKKQGKRRSLDPRARQGPPRRLFALPVEAVAEPSERDVAAPSTGADRDERLSAVNRDMKWIAVATSVFAAIVALGVVTVVVGFSLYTPQ
jgi:hypothetical protein